MYCIWTIQKISMLSIVCHCLAQSVWALGRLALLRSLCMTNGQLTSSRRCTSWFVWGTSPKIALLHVGEVHNCITWAWSTKFGATSATQRRETHTHIYIHICFMFLLVGGNVLKKHWYWIGAHKGGPELLRGWMSWRWEAQWPVATATVNTRIQRYPAGSSNTG